MTALEVVRWAPAVTAAGVLIAAFSLFLSARQQKRQFESFYIQRYWNLMDQLSLEVIRGNHSGSGLNSTDEKVVLGYLRLCEDELELRAGGWISHRTWGVWRKGIHCQLRREPYAQLWASIDAENAAQEQPDFIYLREFLRAGHDPRPTALNRWNRWLAQTWRRARPSAR